MRKLFFIIACMSLGLCASAQKKGSVSLGFASGASYSSNEYTIWGLTNSSLHDTYVSASPFNLSVSPEIGYFVIDRLRLGVSAGFSMQVDKSYSRAENSRTSTLEFAVGPSVSYYFRLADKLYYPPEIGIYYAVGTSKRPLSTHEFSFGLAGGELSATLFALEYKPSDRLGLAFSCGQLSYAALTGRIVRHHIARLSPAPLTRRLQRTQCGVLFRETVPLLGTRYQRGHKRADTTDHASHLAI